MGVLCSSELELGASVESEVIADTNQFDWYYARMCGRSEEERTSAQSELEFALEEMERAQARLATLEHEKKALLAKVWPCCSCIYGGEERCHLSCLRPSSSPRVLTPLPCSCHASYI